MFLTNLSKYPFKEKDAKFMLFRVFLFNFTRFELIVFKFNFWQNFVFFFLNDIKDVFKIELKSGWSLFNHFEQILYLNFVGFIWKHLKILFN